MQLNLIDTLKTSIYNPKHTRNTKKLVIFPTISKIDIFRSCKFKHISVVCWNLLFFSLLRATQPN